MGYIRLFADKDTFIQDRKTSDATAKAGPSANFGASETLEIANRLDPDGWSEHYIKRLLIQFNLSSLTAAVSNGNIKSFIASSVSARLKMFNVIHDQLNPEGFELNVYPVLSAWSEGAGTGPETSPLTGYANWYHRKAGTLWDDPGLSQSGANGSFTASTDVDITASSQTTQFDNGWENIDLDVKSIVTNWVDGLSTNNGLLITLDSTLESVTSYDVGVKKFYGKTTNTVYQPYIEIQYDDYIKDDRNFVPKGTTANLAFYNVVNGRYQDITPGGYGTSTGDFLGTVTLYGATASDGTYAALTGNESGSTLTASRVKKGIYRANFGLALNEYKEKSSVYDSAEYGENFFDDTLQNDYQYFKDVWTVTSNHPLTALSTSSITSTWKASDIFYNATAYSTSDLIINIRNFKPTYNHNSKALFRLFIEKQGTNLTTLTAALDTITSETVTSGWFKILDEETNREVLSYLELDYDKDGNFFEIDMNNLDTGREYRIVLKLNYLGEEKILDTSLFVFSVI
tara:strand:- start:8324 stop:9868 length:1545 start_codon:yes stop_codon:yes gene_type:complete